MPQMPRYLTALEERLAPMPAPAPPAEEPSASKTKAKGKAPAVDAEGAVGTKRPRAAASMVAERTAKRLEALCVHGAALHVCSTYFYRHRALFTSGAESAAGAASSGSAGATDAAATSADATNAAALPQLATTYHALQTHFGAALTPYTWHHDWRRNDAPALLEAIL